MNEACFTQLERAPPKIQATVIVVSTDAPVVP
jgi:hypothetical protein